MSEVLFTISPCGRIVWAGRVGHRSIAVSRAFSVHDEPVQRHYLPGGAEAVRTISLLTSFAAMSTWTVVGLNPALVTTTV